MKIMVNQVLVWTDEQKLYKVESPDEKYANFVISKVSRPYRNIVIYGLNANGVHMTARRFSKELFEEILKTDKNIKLSFRRLNRVEAASIYRVINEVIEKIKKENKH